ncbi:MAG: D-alanyl-D-alanine carboxypeptidase family protein [Clostridia bacterium]|nr:D-alanyl-D-alanine carboxypeptidase family protein [Clostridia bacterium]
MRRLAKALIVLILLTVGAPSSAEAAPAVSVQGACLMEATTGRVLYEHNADQGLPIASTTKIMTALLAIENCNLDELVAIDDEAVGTEGSSMYLGYDETLSVRDLLYGLMLTSGNDAAVALAIHIAGSVEDFATMMNEKAKSLGCENTNFVTPNGLHNSNHYASAMDMSLIASYAMQNEDFAKIVGTTYHETETGAVSRTLKNKNKILWEYEGGCGVKTGYTIAAGKCLVFAAERDGLLLVGTVINCPDMWNGAKNMLDFGFENFEMTTLVDAKTWKASVSVEDGEKKELAAVVEKSIMYPTKKNGEDTVSVSFECVKSLTAPVELNSELGTIRVLVNGQIVGERRLIASQSVDKLGFWYYLMEVLERFIA